MGCSCSVDTFEEFEIDFLSKKDISEAWRYGISAIRTMMRKNLHQEISRILESMCLHPDKYDNPDMSNLKQLCWLMSSYIQSKELELLKDIVNDKNIFD